MTTPTSYSTVFMRRIESKVSIYIGESLRTLIESKHLYQNLHVQPKELAAIIKPDHQEWVSLETADGTADSFGFAEEILQTRWYSKLEAEGWPPIQHPADPRNSQYEFVIPAVLLYCRKCGQRFPCPATHCSEVSRQPSARTPPSAEFAGEQVFALAFKCPYCPSHPQAFLVRRVGAKLTVCGRSPIEHVQVPKTIPKDSARAYSDAIVAADSGQTLAATFLLRVLIERFMRSMVQLDPDVRDVDKVIDAYMDMLPSDFRARFPSFRDIYATLSVPVHTGAAEDSVFFDSLPRIEKHFEARALFELDSVPPPGPSR